MPRYPHTKLFINPSHTVVLSGPHVQVLDTENGHILYSSATIAQNALAHSGPICCSQMSRDGRYLATAGDDKRLKIWDCELLALLSTRELPKKPTSIEFSRDSGILVSDKFGDVFKYAFHFNNEPIQEKTAGDLPAPYKPPCHGDLILGHASHLTSFLLTRDEQFIITADRDEHIRVSWYPQGYVIESYCLGHKKYVSAIHIPAQSPATLISGGGDSELKVWDWITGRLLQDITVFAAVVPFIKVTRRNHVFVVRRISSFLSAGETHVVFSAVGASAIFEFILAETHSHPDIRHYEFGKPVIDFTDCGEGTIWVLLDADFADESDASDEHPSQLVRVVQWSIDKFVDAGSSKLLDSLNTICLLPVAAGDLQVLDLYSDMSILPKGIEAEQGSQLKGFQEPLYTENGEGASLTKRALGRLKHKRALEQLHHEKPDDCDVSGPDAKKMKAGPEDEVLQSTQYEYE